jgi:hypothetical protein
MYYTFNINDIHQALRLLLRAGADLTEGEEGAAADKGKSLPNSYLKMVKAKLKLVTAGRHCSYSIQ